VWEFYPLPGDPTKEEIAAENKKQLEKDMDYAERVQREYEQMNLIK
jgi:hypothetical protein